MRAAAAPAKVTEPATLLAAPVKTGGELLERVSQD